MKQPALLTTVLILAGAAVLVAQTPPKQKPSWRTNNDDVVVENIDSQSIKGTSNTIQIDFKGSPLRGQSRLQAIEFTSQQLLGDLAQNSAKKYFLQKGTLTGNVTITQRAANDELRTLKSASLTLQENANQTQTTITLPSSFSVVTNKGQNLQAGSGIVSLETVGTQREFRNLRLSGGYNAQSTTTAAGTTETYVAKGNSATLDNLGANGKIVSPGKLDIDYTARTTTNDPTKNQSLSFRSGGGEIVLPANGAQSSRPIVSADLQGRITATADTWTKPTEGPPEKINLVAMGDRLTITKDGVMTLNGNVTIEINGGTGLKGSGDILVVRFDQAMNVISWETRGVPGRIQGGGTKRR